MMTSNSTPNFSHCHDESQLREVLREEIQENNQNPSETELSVSVEVSIEENQISSDQSSQRDVVELPEPDADNITVLSNKLPNTPILPWNHYDSPWESSEESSETVVDDTSKREDAQHQSIADEESTPLIKKSSKNKFKRGEEE